MFDQVLTSRWFDLRVFILFKALIMQLDCCELTKITQIHLQAMSLVPKYIWFRLICVLQVVVSAGTLVTSFQILSVKNNWFKLVIFLQQFKINTGGNKKKKINYGKSQLVLDSGFWRWFTQCCPWDVLQNKPPDWTTWRGSLLISFLDLTQVFWECVPLSWYFEHSHCVLRIWCFNT